MSIANLTNVFEQADAIDVSEGMIAYNRYRNTMFRFAEYYNFPLENVVAAFVALSPNNDYKGNLKSMVTLLHGIRCGWHKEEVTVTTYHACRDRAYYFAIGRNNFLNTTKGPKTRAFFQNILDPTNCSPVTVDGHMLSIWHLKRMTMVQAVRLRTPYEDVAMGIRQLAFGRCIVPCQVQAILWFTWKRLHNVVYDSQLSLFKSNDQWGTDVMPQTIKPFPRKVV